MLNTFDLHTKFVKSLSTELLEKTNITVHKPLVIELCNPMNIKIKVYLFNATPDSGGRNDDYKITLKVPNQTYGERGKLDIDNEYFTILAGYITSLDVFILWDAYLKSEFAYNSNCQVKAQTVLNALLNDISEQERKLKSKEIETILTSTSLNLPKAIKRRVELSFNDGGDLK